MGTALVSIAFGLMVSLFDTGASAQATLNSVKAKGFLTCGSNTGLAGFSMADAQGRWTGLDVDFCRAIAAAIFDDPTKVRFIPLAAKDRFTALQSGEVDVLARNSTTTMSRETQLGLDFPAINYFDGQGFMVRKKLGVASAKELNGASICAAGHHDRAQPRRLLPCQQHEVRSGGFRDLGRGLRSIRGR